MTPKSKIEFLLIKDEDSKCNSIDTLVNLFVSDSEIKFINSSTLSIGEDEAEFHISTDTIKKEIDERYFLITIEKENDEANESAIILCLINIYNKIKEVIVASRIFKIAELWNDTSFYYSRLSYPHIYKVENLMRMLIYKFMLTRLGKNWEKTGLTSKVKEAIKLKNNNEEKSVYFDDILYKFDFIHLSTFLFTPYSTESNKVFEKISKAKKIEDLVLKELNEIVPIDNWDRYFKQIIKHKDFKKDWDELYKLRCKIAHNNFISQHEFEQIEKKSQVLIEKISNGIRSVSKIVIKSDDIQDLSNSALNSFFEPLYSNLLNYPSNYILTSDLLNKSNEAISNLYSQNFQINGSSIFLSTPKSCIICGKKFYTEATSVISLNSHHICNDCKNGQIKVVLKS